MSIFPALLALFMSSAWAQPMDVGGSFGPLDEKVSVRYFGSFSPEADGHGTDDLSVEQHGASVSLPVLGAPGRSLSVSARGQWTGLSRQITLPRDPKLIARDLYDFQVGPSFKVQREDGDLMGASASFGSASDAPFDSTDVNTVGANLFYTNRASARDTWSYFLNYSNNRNFLNGIPIPGVAFTYVPGPHFRGTFGLPFLNLVWKWHERWGMNLFAFGPWRTHLDVFFSLFGPARLFLAHDVSQQNYLLRHRTHRRERLFFEEKKLYLGAVMPVPGGLLAELQLGQVYESSLFEVRKYSDRHLNRLGLGQTYFARLAVSARF